MAFFFWRNLILSVNICGMDAKKNCFRITLTARNLSADSIHRHHNKLIVQMTFSFATLIKPSGIVPNQGSLTWLFKLCLRTCKWNWNLMSITIHSGLDGLLLGRCLKWCRFHLEVGGMLRKGKLSRRNEATFKFWVSLPAILHKFTEFRATCHQIWKH